MRKVLVLEDETNIRSFVVINLKRAGYDTIEAGTGEEALALIQKNPDVQVALLDIMLPGEIDGFEVCRRIRAGNPQVGIIMLTARTQEMDKVSGLMTGADDYVTKPFSPAELTARVDALFRRTGGAPVRDVDELSQPPFLLNTRNRTLEKNGKRVKLTFYEDDSGMPAFHEWCVIQDFDGAWANVEVVVNQKKPQKNEVRLIPLSAISTITFLKDGEAARRSPLELS